MRLSKLIDEANDRFTSQAKATVLSWLSHLPTDRLEWLVMEHYQFSFANCSLLRSAMQCTSSLDEKGVSMELERNLQEEDGHAPMYKKGMWEIGTDMERRATFAPTSTFLAELDRLSTESPSCALGTLYATETAAIFEHETLDQVCRELCTRRGFVYETSLIKRFHFIHLEGGVEQGHKDGLAHLVDLETLSHAYMGGAIDRDAVYAGAIAAINAMKVWWNALIAEISDDNRWIGKKNSYVALLCNYE